MIAPGLFPGCSLSGCLPRSGKQVMGGMAVGMIAVAIFLPSGGSAQADPACVKPGRVVVVKFSDARWPNLTRHIRQVRDRYPPALHIDRAHADEHRRESLRGIPTRTGYDRDEYPPAMLLEGGDGHEGRYSGRPAHVAYVASGENRSAGASMGARLRPYCDGTRVTLRVTR